MPESELWITRLFNEHLPGLGNWFLGLAGAHPQPHGGPWADFVVMQIVVAALLVMMFTILRFRLSPDRPGKLQQTLELVYEFVRGQAEDQLGQEAARRYLSFFGTIFVFILVSNLIGLIPAFESPTMNVPVTLGCAMATFSYYHLMGIRTHGWKYAATFAGPLWWLAPLMFPIEIISHFARVLSLTVRLYANMFAGEKVTLAFLTMVPLAVPVIFMGLHLFVGVIQAYIFMLLSMAYVSGAVSHEH